MRAVITIEYDADPEDYDWCSGPEQMAQIDAKEFRRLGVDGGFLAAYFNAGELAKAKIEVMPA